MPAAVKAGGVYADKAGVFLKTAGAYGSVAGSLWTPLADPSTAAYFEAGDLADGAVASWLSKTPTQRAVVQATGANQPIKGATGVVFDGTNDLLAGAAPPRFIRSIKLPEGADPALPGKGTIGCGLAKLPSGNWLVTNHGDKSPGRDGSGPFAPSVMEMLPDFSAIVPGTEIQLKSVWADISSGQACAYDSTRDQIWISDVLVERVRLMTRAGAPVRDITGLPFKPSGLDYDGIRDWLIITQRDADGSNYCIVNAATGAVVIGPLSTGLGAVNQDQVRVYADKMVFGVSYGPNVAGSDGIRYFDYSPAAFGTPAGAIQLGDIAIDANTDAIEGHYYDFATGILTLLSDSGYHTTGNNRAIQYYAEPPCGRQMAMFAVLTEPTSTGVDAIMSMGDAIGSAGIGYAWTTAGNTSVQNYVQSGGSVATSRDAYLATVPSLTAPRIAWVENNLDTALQSVYVDGALVGTSPIANYKAQAFPNCTALRISAAADSRPASMTLQACGTVIGSVANRHKFEGYLAWKYGLVAQLPGGHPYKTAAPT